MDETYIKVKGEWKYIYRAVDSDGDTIDFMLSAKRNRKAAKRFLKKALSSNHNQMPRVMNHFRYLTFIRKGNMIEYFLTKFN
jgi:transposase-like protein